LCREGELGRKQRDDDELGGESGTLLAVPRRVGVRSFERTGIRGDVNAVAIAEIDDVDERLGRQKLGSGARYKPCHARPDALGIGARDIGLQRAGVGARRSRDVADKHGQRTNND
jgi:hypothetical protein